MQTPARTRWPLSGMAENLGASGHLVEDARFMTGPSDLYRYRATVLDWHDGDTAHVDVDLGVRVHWQGSLRCGGYNAPEITGKTKPAGEAATTYVRSLIPDGTTVYLNSLAFEPDEEDNFGRMLGVVTLPDGRDLAVLMIQSGNAVPDPAPRG